MWLDAYPAGLEIRQELEVVAVSPASLPLRSKCRRPW